MKRKRYSICLLIGSLSILGLLLMPAACINGSSPVSPVSRLAGPPSGPDFVELVKKVTPSVVAITTESVTYDSYNNANTEQGSGSGWIVDENGTVVTNNHVVEGAKTITVEFSDHKAFVATSVTADPTTDVATLKVNRGQKTVPLKPHKVENVKVGQWVLILGNPLGMGISVKQGIISRLGVTMSSSPEQVYNNLVEISAAVNPGNSGGPMVDMDGDVIGMTSLKIDAAGIEGMGYAIEINDVMPIIQVLAKGQPYPRAWLGASLTSVDNGLAVLYNLPVESGALVVSLSQGSPADRGGLMKGDLIVAFENAGISSADDLNRLVSSSKPGQRVSLSFWRGNEQRTAQFVLADGPPTPSPAPTSS
jgi:serine protease Do